MSNSVQSENKEPTAVAEPVRIESKRLRTVGSARARAIFRQFGIDVNPGAEKMMGGNSSLWVKPHYHLKMWTIHWRSFNWERRARMCCLEEPRLQ